MRGRTVLTTLAEAQLELLSHIMPQHVIQFLAMESTEAVCEHVGQLARAHKSATLMFMDVCGFTAMSKEVEPVQVMIFLNTLFSHIDKLVDMYGVHKVETAGDCYIVAGGIMKQAADADGFRQIVEDHNPAESANNVMQFAKAVLNVAGQVQMPNTQEPVCIRIGMHTGDVVSGMIGTKLPKFSIFGDAVNTSSRMESTGVPGKIHVSEATRNLLPSEMWEATGGVEVKGKGQMKSYLWTPDTSRLSGGQGIDATSSIPLGHREAQQHVQGNSLPLPALRPAIRLLCSPLTSQATMSYDFPKETSDHLFLGAKAAGSSMPPSKIIKATQTLSQKLYKTGEHQEPLRL
ncbi:nucleotide cyclase [Dunaliella salina]|nr:nucleotide cyclase [Dunaliella salina]|eukprot:KAF5829149.1 nucleotide cyclase [Dunaliella salina]